MLRGAAGGGDTSPMCGAVLNARKHCDTPLVKPRTSLRASHLSSHLRSPPSRARVAPRPSCARLHRLPAHPPRPPPPAGVVRRPRQRPLVVPPRTVAVARHSPHSARKRRAASLPRPAPSPGTAAPPSARGGATGVAPHRDLPAVTEAGDCGRLGDGDGAPVEGAGSRLPILVAPRRRVAPSSPRAAPTAATGVLGRLESHATHRTAAAAPTAATAGRVAL